MGGIIVESYRVPGSEPALLKALCMQENKGKNI
jgi:hypothetical protein